MSLRALARKEFLHLRRDRRMLGFVFFGPILFLFLFAYAIRLQLEDVPLVVWDGDHSIFSQQVRDELWRSDTFVSREVARRQDVRDALLRGTAKVGVIIPPGFTRALADGETAELELLLDGTMPTIAVAARADASDLLGGAELQSELRLSAVDQAEAPEPLPPAFAVKKTVLFNPELRDQTFFLPGIVGILIMQVSLILASLAMVREREHRTLEQLLVTPATRSAIVVGKLVPYALISALDFAVILALAVALFDVPMRGSAVELALVGCVYITGFLSLGMLISTLSQTQPQAIFLAVFILIPSMLLSGFVFPVEAMPRALQPLPPLIPLYHFLILVRGIMLKGAGLRVLWPHFAALAGFTLLFVGISSARLRKTLA